MIGRQVFWNKYYVTDERASFQTRWLFAVMNVCHINMSGLADKLRISRQAVSALVNGHSKLSFVMVVAICFLCKTNDDPEEIWKMIEEDRKEKNE